MNPLLRSYLQFVKRLILALQGDQGVVGFDIGPTACHAVELRRKKDGFEVISWATEMIEGLDEKGALGKVLAKMGPSVRNRTAVVSVSGKGTLIRHIDMPRMSNADLRKIFAMETDKYFPFPKETVYTDCFMLDPNGTDKKMPVLVAAVKKDIIDARLKLLRDAGIDPATVTVASIAVANTFSALPPATCSVADLGGKAVAVIDIGETLTNLMIMSDGIPRFTRDIFMGMADVVRRLAHMTGLPLPQARALCVPGAMAGREQDVQKSVEAVLTNLVTEIRLSFGYFTTEKNLPVGRICLVGEGGHVPYVEAVFSGNFDIPLVAWNPAERLVIASDREAFLKEGGRMVTVLGLALGEYDQT